MKSISFRVAVATAALALVTACKGSDEPRTPLGAPPVGSSGTEPSIGGEARVALDSANALFRLRSYDAALSQYNRAAELAPTELAPLLGVMMVADITNNSKLADETRPRIRKLDPAYSDSAAGSHSKIIKSHPPTKPVTPEA